MSKLAYLIALLVGLASFQTASAVGCLYADVFEKKWRDSDEPQDIYSIKLTQEREGLQINFLQSTTNEFLVKVYYNAGGFLPAVSRLDGSLVEVNINGLLYLLPGASSHMSAELSLLLAGAAHAAAFQDGKKCATLLGAAYFLTKIIGVHAQVQSCPIIKVEIYSPPGRCKVDGYDTSLEGYWLVDCPLPPTPPTTFPTRAPTYFPTTSAPSPQPTTATPTLFVPTEFPTRSPTKLPTVSPTHFPTRSPTTSAPTTSPSRFPTPSPTLFPTLSCRSYAQLGNNCSDRDDCYEAALDPGIFEILLSSPDIDATTKQLLQAFLSLPNCYTTSEIPNLCLSLDTGSCENAVSDGYCTDVSVFQYESVKWLDGYDRPGSNCFPMTAVGICEQQTNLQDCNATIEQFLEFERECLWLDYGSGNTVCRSPGNFSTSECAGLTEQSCDATEPVCTYDGSCLENCVYHASQPACESHPDCQWLSKTVGSPFCSLILRFPAEDCIGLTQASCNAALTQKVNPSDGINITANACVYNTTTSSCRAVDITALAEVSCHPAHSKVQVEHEGFRRIEEVHVGQNILSDVGFEPIIAIIHSEKAVIPFYYHIETDDFAMDVARGHLIMANGQPKDPKDIKKGHPPFPFFFSLGLASEGDQAKRRHPAIRRGDRFLGRTPASLSSPSPALPSICPRPRAPPILTSTPRPGPRSSGPKS